MWPFLFEGGSGQGAALLRLDLSALVAACLEVEGALVLQPSSVACYAADLLAVVVWRRVGERGDGGVDAVALDAVEEGRVFLCGR